VIHSTESKTIPIDSIEMGHRYQQPTETEIEQMLTSIRKDGLLTFIGVSVSGDKFCLRYGATRLMACKKLGWTEIPAVVFEGGPEELASAELIENLERRHLDKVQRDELTKQLVKLQAGEIKSEQQK
jgi:ParB family chromosome partitioning protein